MNLYHIKLTDNQKDALERLFNMGIVWNKTELSEAWEQLREQVREASCTVAIINAIQNSECNCKKPTAPKNDPCRKLRKGDIVTPRIRDGRIPWGTLSSGIRINLDEKRRYIVSTGEKWNEVRIDPIVDISGIAHTNITVNACYLEVIAHAEESYSVREDNEVCEVQQGDTTFSVFYKVKYGENSAKAAAEAECARLNREHRKEQSND